MIKDISAQEDTGVIKHYRCCTETLEDLHGCGGLQTMTSLEMASKDQEFVQVLHAANSRHLGDVTKSWFNLPVGKTDYQLHGD